MQHTWPLLRALDLSHNRLTGQEMEAFLASPTAFPHLERLNLSSTQIQAPILEAMAQGKGWAQLRELELNSNALGRLTSLPDLVASLPALEFVSLQWCYLEDEDVALLQKCPWPASMRRLDLCNNRINESQRDKLKAMFEGQVTLGDSLEGWRPDPLSMMDILPAWLD